jgi:dTDP-4-amino-4,6-dideoxygalactose transaminase
MKQVKTATDLAINGATPAFSEPLHVGRPNVGSRQDFLQKIGEMLDRRWFTNNGPLVQEFEERIARHLGVKHCVAMCNGTIALEIAIRALDLAGEVIVPSWTFIATAHALSWQGITPVFADIDAMTHNLDPESVRRMITPRTTGIIGVHVWGRPAPIKELQSLADEYGLKLLFDAAHAFGCSFEGRMIGNFGSCEVMSFHATKFFNTFEGGAVVTNDDTLAEKLKLMRNFGFSGYDNVVYAGTNGKMIEPCAAMGLANLNSLEEMVATNERYHSIYREALKDIEGLQVLPFDESARNNYQYIVLEIDERHSLSRDRLVEVLHAENVLARRYFWPGCHGMKPYRELFPLAKFALANTEEIAKRVIVLPTGSGVSVEQVEIIAQIIRIASYSIQ